MVGCGRMGKREREWAATRGCNACVREIIEIKLTWRGANEHKVLEAIKHPNCNVLIHKKRQ